MCVCVCMYVLKYVCFDTYRYICKINKSDKTNRNITFVFIFLLFLSYKKRDFFYHLYRYDSPAALYAHKENIWTKSLMGTAQKRNALFRTNPGSNTP